MTDPTTTSDADSSTGDPPPGCGNNIREPSLEENCDGEDLPSKTCADVGLQGGALTCYPPDTELECTYDLTMCTGAQQCGNNMIEGNEPCDGTDLGEQTCETYSENFIGGDLSCRPDCEMFDTSECVFCRTSGQECDDELRCCDGLLCGIVTGTCGLL